MSERSAWFCPACQKHHAPHVETCPGGTGGVKPISSPAPVFIPYFEVLPDMCAGCKGTCGNVACPKLPRTTAAALPPDWNKVWSGQATYLWSGSGTETAQ